MCCDIMNDRGVGGALEVTSGPRDSLLLLMSAVQQTEHVYFGLKGCTDGAEADSKSIYRESRSPFCIDLHCQYLRQMTVLLATDTHLMVI